MPSFDRYLLPAMLGMLVAGCGGGSSGSSAMPPPPAQPATVTIRYLRVEPAYDGWGLHLWGSALAPGVATAWESPRAFDRIAAGAAVFEIPVADESGELNFVVHNGDLKSPVHDMTLEPLRFGREVWVVQDSVATLSGDRGVPFGNEAAARAALAELGNRSATLDLSVVAVVDADSGLDPDWSSAAAFAEIYVRGFQDSDGDGTGDLRGLVSRLDYLQELGIGAIWLMPVTESADDDHGYAVADYRAIESDYGTMADFEALLAAAHARGIAVIIDYVMNHASSTNPLFLDASTGAGNDKRDWFVWRDNRPQGWNTFAGDPWRNNGNGWYYGIFSPLMPDFDLTNPEVVEFHRNNLRFWLNKGVDGFRFDAVGVLFEDGPAAWEDSPRNHALLADVRALIEQYGKRYAVCEAPSAPADYAADASCGRAFAFGVQGAILQSARGDSVDGGFVGQLRLAAADRMPLFLANHDSFAGARVFDQLGGNEEQYRMAAASYLLAAQNPFVYYGEEVGMAGAAGLSGDHALRAPMSWTDDPLTAGFSTAGPFRALAGNSQTHNVARHSADPASLLAHYRALLDARRRYPVIGGGALEVQADGGDAVLVLTRTDESACAVVAINYGAVSEIVSAASACPSSTFSAVFGAAQAASSDPAGSVTLSVPARTAVVYVAAR